MEPRVLGEPILVFAHLKLNLFWKCVYLVLDVTRENSPHVDGRADLERPKHKRFGLAVLFQEVTHTDADKGPPIWLDRQRDLQVAPICVFEFLIDVRKRDFS